MSTFHDKKDNLCAGPSDDGKNIGAGSEKGGLPGMEGSRQGEDDFLDLLGRIPGKVSGLQEEIDRMKKKQNR